MKILLALLILLGSALGLGAQEEDAFAAQKATIATERSDAEAAFLAQEKVCYGKFAVNDCVNAARVKRREALADLRRREISLNDAERRRRAAERLRDIDRRNPSEAQPNPAGQGDRQTRASTKGVEGAARAASAPAQALQRAERAEREKSSKEAARAQKAGEAETHRHLQQVKLEEAQERRAKLEKRLAERKKPAAQPLPVPP